jgi:DNA-binding response OmpR family regulator
MTNILQIDDDRILCELLKTYLKDHGFDLSTANTPSGGLDLFEKLKPKLVILDVMMPEQDGFSVIQHIRRTKSVPVIMLTARGESADRILGLELGADDYLTKPFEPRELVARIKAILKRANQQPEDKIISGNITIDPTRRTITIKDQELDLTTSEYDLLFTLVSNPGRKFTRDDLLSSLRGEDIEAFGRSIDNLVSRLRRKLSKHGDGDSIQTVWGTGYTYVEAAGKK